MAGNELTKANALKNILSSNSVKEQFENALKENSGLFVASLIDLYTTDSYLGKCDPKAVVQEALKAATLKLPINKQLGFAYIVPYKNTPTFQLGYKGYIQLAMRTAQYRYLNCDVVYEGELKGKDKLTGQIDLTGDAISENVIGYFAYMELVNGFKKTLYMHKEEVISHAKRYSPSFAHSSSAWKTNFDEMALKTVVRRLLSKFGIMSVQMASAFAADDDLDHELRVNKEVTENANTELIDVQAEDVAEPVQEPDQSQQRKIGPDF